MQRARKKSGGARKAAVAAIGVALSAGGLAYVFSDVLFGQADLAVRLDEILVSWRTRIHVAPLVASIASYWVGLVLLRAALVRHLLAPIGRLRMGQTYRYVCIGFLANNVLPFKAGEVARSAAISKGGRMSFASVVGALALERMLDMAMVVIIAVAAIQVAALPRAVADLALILGICLVLAFAALFALGPRRLGLLSRFARGRIGRLLAPVTDRFSAGFFAQGNVRGLLGALALSASIWAVALFAVTARLAAFDLPASVPMGLVLLTSLGFGVAVPSAPGYLGVYHAAVVFALETMGVETSVAVSFGWLSWLLDMGLGSVAGAASLSIEGLKLKDLQTGERSENGAAIDR